MTATSFTIPLVPPSVNHYKLPNGRGGYRLSDEAITFKDEVAIARQGRAVLAKQFSVRLLIVLGKGDRGDVDNFAKVPLDALAAAGVFLDPKGKRLSDAHVNSLQIMLDKKARPDRGYTQVWIEGVY